MASCSGIKADGQRCYGTAMEGHDHCYAHREDLAEERRRNASKGGRRGGRGRGSGELAAIKALLSELTDRVIGKEGTAHLPPNAGAVAAQLINTRLRAVELERKIKETEELEERLRALERAAEGNDRGGRRWGA